MRWGWLFALLLAGCARGPVADLASIKQARSLGAEWALVNQQAHRGALTATYAAAMHRSLRRQLQTTAGSLTRPESAYGAEIRALLQQPDEAPPAQLRAHVDRLKQQENTLESA